MTGGLEFGPLPLQGRPRRVAPCPVPGCARRVWASGMCLYHYKRWRSGRPIHEPQPGDASGMGRYGVMDRTDDEVMCHECGGWMVSVGAHIGRAHDLTAREYRRRHGIPQSEPLISSALSRQRSEQSHARVGSPEWERMVIARDPDAAQRARGAEAFERRGERVIEVARENGRLREAIPHACLSCGAMITGRRRTCSDLCLQAYRADLASARGRSPRPMPTAAEAMRLAESADPALIRDLQGRGVRQADIAVTLGRSPGWMSEHYPRAGTPEPPPTSG